jgi:hypothetical protein
MFGPLRQSTRIHSASFVVAKRGGNDGIELHCGAISAIDCIYVWMYTQYMRTKVTLSIDEDLYREIKIQAIREDRDVSTITEEVYREYLKRSKAKGKK